MIIAGIDYGTTQVKAVILKNKVMTGAKCFPRNIFKGETAEKLMLEFLGECEIPATDVQIFSLTGVGAKDVGETFLGIKTVIFDEFASITKGALMLSGMSRALIASVGTGSAFVMAESPDEFAHIGGSGVGGGTLMGLAKAFLNVETPEQFGELLKGGSLSKVDLTIGDVSGGSLSMLSADVTSSNFGKVMPDAKPEDFALGLYNMVCQTIGMLAVFALRGSDVKDVLLCGGTVTYPRAEELFSLFHTMFDKRFHIITHSTYAASMGAALLAENM